MDTTHWMVSADSHILEPPSIWERLDREFAEHAPRLEHEDDGDWWYVEGVRSLGMTVGAFAGKRFEGLDSLRLQGRWEDVPVGAYDPTAFVADNEVDGVWAAALYPTLGSHLYGRVPDPAVLSALCRAYNDWLAEFCATSPDRLIGMAMINVDDADDAVGEMERTRALGLRGTRFPLVPGAGESWADPRFEPVWAAAQDLEMPVGFHVGGARVARTTPFGTGNIATAVYRPNIDNDVRTALTQVIYAGVFERFPRLRVGAVEYESGWVPHWLDRLDDTYSGNWLGHYVHHYRDFDRPSDVFRAHCFVTFEEDARGVRDRHDIGIDTLMWSNDYPHTESTWPHSRKIVEELMAGVPDAERDKLVASNAALLYGIQLPPAS